MAGLRTVRPGEGPLCRARGIGSRPGRLGPVAAQLVPGTVGLQIGNPTLGINAHGVAVLAWSFASPYAAWWDKPWGTAAVMWRLGHPLGSSTVLSATPGSHEGGVNSVAINSLGTAVVMFHDQRGLEAARLRHEQFQGVQTLSDASEAARDVESFATPSNGFQASWRLSTTFGYEQQPSTLSQATVERARAATDGQFSVEPPSTIPLLITPPLEPPYDSAWGLALRSNIRGDQLLAWGASGPAGRRVYADSRRAGSGFRAIQVVGTPPAVSRVESVIGPTGHFTVLWIGARGVEATAGVAGGGTESLAPSEHG